MTLDEYPADDLPAHYREAIERARETQRVLRPGIPLVLPHARFAAPGDLLVPHEDVLMGFVPRYVGKGAAGPVEMGAIGRWREEGGAAPLPLPEGWELEPVIMRWEDEERRLRELLYGAGDPNAPPPTGILKGDEQAEGGA